MACKIKTAAFLLAATVAVPATGHAQETQIGADEYAASCSICHGADGRGHGEFASVLKVQPSDLTMLAKENDGQFPFLKVFQTIDGRTQIGAHGTRDMPIWGRRYSEDIGEKFGPYGGEIAIRARVMELVYYLQSIQEQ